MIPRHYPFVLDFHAEAGGVGWDDAAVLGHGHAGYGADFFEGDAGVGAHPELGHCEGEVLAVGCAGAGVGALYVYEVYLNLLVESMNVAPTVKSPHPFLDRVSRVHWTDGGWYDYGQKWNYSNLTGGLADNDEVCAV